MGKIEMRCKNCGGSFGVRTYREYVLCPYCRTRIPFPGFEYKHIDWSYSEYAKVKLWMDCPACRGPSAYLGPEGKKWICPDCGYTISDKEKRKGVFWFCDDCGTFLNVQEGFTTKSGRWTCTECHYTNDVTNDNIV